MDKLVASFEAKTGIITDPPDVSTPVDITGFLSTNVQDPKIATALLAYLSSHEVAPIYEAAKIFPAH
jgi:hypothetical protein